VSGSSSFPEFDYSNSSTVLGASGHINFSNIFGTESAIGVQGAIYNGTGAVPPASDSANASLVVTGGSATTTPDGYRAVYDLSNNDTITGATNASEFICKTIATMSEPQATTPSMPVVRTQLWRVRARPTFSPEARRDGLGRWRQPAIRRGRWRRFSGGRLG
jgi:hypothetical protein